MNKTISNITQLKKDKIIAKMKTDFDTLFNYQILDAYIVRITVNGNNLKFIAFHCKMDKVSKAALGSVYLVDSESAKDTKTLIEKSDLNDKQKDFFYKLFEKSTNSLFVPGGLSKSAEEKKEFYLKMFEVFGGENVSIEVI